MTGFGYYAVSLITDSGEGVWLSMKYFEIDRPPHMRDFIEKIGRLPL
ncbi:MAG: hypothetical protein JW838_00115 [Spirochaetes bacterium]|nr:hypothetical protein [Spirochaetota bacterium]